MLKNAVRNVRMQNKLEKEIGEGNFSGITFIIVDEEDDMNHLEMTSGVFRVIVVPLPLDNLEWTGQVCENCFSNLYNIKWVLEIQPFLRVYDNEYQLLEKDVCMECEDIAEVLAHESAHVVKDIYGPVKGLA